jgi:uncharacterized protein (DUF924 family)
MTQDISPSDVVAFWKEAGPDKWFKKDETFDALFRRRFHDAHVAAARRELDHWSETAEGSLGLLILLDQFPRNAFRGTGHAYATDPLARMFARRAIDAGHDLEIEGDIRRFFYLPLQHSEDMADQKRQVELFQTRMERKPDDRWAEHHHGVVARFGRFPHRNAALGRETTTAEAAFLEADGFSG